MSNQIIIGTQGNQSFAIPDPKVSRHHAILIIEDNGQLFIVDNSSTNGTFIHSGNGFVRIYPNQPYPVTPDTMIQLGPETRFHIRRLLTPQNANATPTPSATVKKTAAEQKKPPKKVDISHLRRISEHYENQKMRIDSKSGVINNMRTITPIILLIATLVSSVVMGESDSKYVNIIFVILIAGVLLGVLMYFINLGNKKVIKQRKDNEHNYAVKYVCPECHVSFRGKIYENILAEKKCPRCKTEYYEQKSAN